MVLGKGNLLTGKLPEITAAAISVYAEQEMDMDLSKEIRASVQLVEKMILELIGEPNQR